MLKKNIEKENRKNRPLWVGYHSRITKTKKEKIEKDQKKHKNKVERVFAY